MTVGLGSGSTARYATLRLAERLRNGDVRGIVGVPTSEETGRLAEREGIPLANLEEWLHIDLTIDGADEVDPSLNVIKGRGGFLLREKIVAFATHSEVIVVDDSKLVDVLGTRSPIPVEVVPFGWRHTKGALDDTGALVKRRVSSGTPFVTDEGHYVLDCRYPAIDCPPELAATIEAIPGVVEHGLFLGMVHAVVVASHKGVRVITR